MGAIESTASRPAGWNDAAKNFQVGDRAVYRSPHGFEVQGTIVQVGTDQNGWRVYAFQQDNSPAPPRHVHGWDFIRVESSRPTTVITQVAPAYTPQPQAYPYPPQQPQYPANPYPPQQSQYPANPYPTQTYPPQAAQAPYPQQAAYPAQPTYAQPAQAPYPQQAAYPAQPAYAQPQQPYPAPSYAPAGEAPPPYAPPTGYPTKS